jgi:phage recombination protein Bet
MSAEATQVTVITKGEVAQAHQQRVSLLETFAHKYGLDPKNMMRTLKATAFKGDVSDDQMAALLIVAKAHNLNPWTKEIYAFPSRQGIVPIVGVDGWARIINEHPQFDGMDFALSGETGKEAYTCTIHRKDRAHPVTVTEYMTECFRPTDPWKSHPLRMLRHKAMIQCARLAFSFAGIYDPDEGERVLAAENAIDVTPVEEREQSTNFGPVKIGAVKMRKIIQDAVKASGLNAAGEIEEGAQDAVALWKVWGPLSNAEIELVWKQLRSYERSAIKKLQTTNEYKIAESGLDIPAWSISVLQAAKDLAAVDKAYATIEEIYAEQDQEVPLDIQTIRHDRRAELGAVQ